MTGGGLVKQPSMKKSDEEKGGAVEMMTMMVAGAHGAKMMTVRIDRVRDVSMMTVRIAGVRDSKMTITSVAGFDVMIATAMTFKVQEHCCCSGMETAAMTTMVMTMTAGAAWTTMSCMQRRDMDMMATMTWMKATIEGAARTTMVRLQEITFLTPRWRWYCKASAHEWRKQHWKKSKWSNAAGQWFATSKVLNGKECK